LENASLDDFEDVDKSIESIGVSDQKIVVIPEATNLERSTNLGNNPESEAHQKNMG